MPITVVKHCKSMILDKNARYLKHIITTNYLLILICTLFFFSLLSTILTGFIQVLIGIKMILKEPRNLYLQIYIIGVLLYFSIYFISLYFRIYQILDIFFLGVPPLLAIYLSVLIYKKANK